MPFVPENLDDRTFEDLVSEARRRISAYVPDWKVDQRGRAARQWSEYNTSDPGIAIVDVFAWLTETLLYRLNRLPDERMYVEFLDLLGFAPRPPQPASMPVQATMEPTGGVVSLLAHELRFSAPGEDDDIFFEASEDVHLVKANLGALVLDDRVSSQVQDLTALNLAPDQDYAPFGEARLRNRALHFGFDTEIDAATNKPAPILGVSNEGRLRIYVRTVEEEAALQPASTVQGPRPVQAAQPTSDVVWEGLDKDGQWFALEVVADRTDALRSNGFVEVTLTSKLTPQVGPATDGALRHWIRARVHATSREERRRVRYVAPNAVVLVQWRTYAEERVGASDGSPNQTFDVRHAPILMTDDFPPSVLVKEPDEEIWELVEDLGDRRGRDDSPGPRRIFAVSPDRASIKFGDGIEGRIPPSGTNNVFVTYRSGGGAVGNGQKSLTREFAISDIRTVEPLELATGGQDEEPIEVARRTAPGRVRSLDAAVTASNFEALALDAGAARAIALDRHDPRFPSAPATGAVTLIVVPEAPRDEVAPMPDQALLAHVAGELDRFRVLTTELFVIAPVYEDVSAEVVVVPARPTDADRARDEVSARIEDYLHPTRGGADGDGWPVGRRIVNNELASELLRLESVGSIRKLVLHVRGQTFDCEDVEMREGAHLWRSALHQIGIERGDR